MAGTCIGDKGWSCPACAAAPTTQALKVIELLVSTDGYKGSALDVDGDPETCAPPGECGDGIDNALAVLAPLVNDPFATAIEEGSVMYVVDFDQAVVGGAEFPFGIYDCDLSEASYEAGCNFQVEECSYVPEQFSFGPDCKPYFGLPNATIAGGKLTAGGKGYVMTMALPMAGSETVPFTIANAMVSADLKLAPDGTTILGATGIVGGATPKAHLIKTIKAISADAFPVDKDLAIQLLDAVIQNDIDLDGDGVYDAASVGMRFLTIPADLE